MAEINVLDKEIFTRIAAGEVVDRPYSIVKELVENSIDAGATKIDITIKNGGIDYINVSDNGNGISALDVKTAFLPHATSKIKNLEDLDGISTLGFRGEALPSIASVSRVTMLTRPKSSAIGYRYIIDNGVECDCGEMGAPLGTSVTVENLFERIPARKKFLSKNNIEENAISSLVLRYILANSNISFEYTVNDKKIYSTVGSGVENAIKTVYGKEFFDNLVEINSTMSGIKVYGYVNSPAFSKHSKTYQTLIVNGRYVNSEEISYLIFGCYQKYLMKRQYPAYVLYLELPYDMVDVNVHPNKMQVKFAMPALVKKIISDAIMSQVFYRTKNSNNSNVDIFEDVPVVIEKKNSSQQQMHFDYIQVENKSNDIAVQTVQKDNENIANQKVQKINSNVLGDLNFNEKVKIKSTFRDKIGVSEPLDNCNFVDVFDTQNLSKIVSASSSCSHNILAPIKIIGKLFNTYIVIEKENNIFLLDQHAVHEKILYDRYVSEFENGNIAIQKMLLPYAFNVSAEEGSIIDSNISCLLELGFEIKKTAHDTFEILSIPACCVGLNMKNFIADFLNINKNGNKYDNMPSAYRENLMQYACKSAVKGEDDLSLCEIESLLSQMTQETKELFCPHGRPIVIKITRNEIEKWFKRIV